MISIEWKALPHLAESLKKILKKKKANEQRLHPRAKSRNLIRSEVANSSGYSQNLSNLVDLSESGLRFAARDKMKVGTVLKMMINLVEKKAQVPVVGVVVWVRQIRRGNPGYYIGVSFVQISEEHRHLMHELVETYRQRPVSRKA